MGAVERGVSRGDKYSSTRFNSERSAKKAKAKSAMATASLRDFLPVLADTLPSNCVLVSHSDQSEFFAGNSSNATIWVDSCVAPLGAFDSLHKLNTAMLTPADGCFVKELK